MSKYFANLTAHKLLLSLLTTHMLAIPTYEEVPMLNPLEWLKSSAFSPYHVTFITLLSRVGQFHDHGICQLYFMSPWTNL
jgi:hypothetical protein